MEAPEISDVPFDYLPGLGGREGFPLVGIFPIPRMRPGQLFDGMKC